MFAIRLTRVAAIVAAVSLAACGSDGGSSGGSGGAVGKPPPGGTSHWRLYITGASGGGHVTIDEFQLFGQPDGAGGGLITPSTAITCSSHYEEPGGVPHYPLLAIDGTTAYWESNGGLPATPAWLDVDFGAGNKKDVKSFSIQTVNFITEHPTAFALQWSDNGTDYTTVVAFAGITWMPSETKVFNVPAE
jgi:hypothetical protein